MADGDRVKIKFPKRQNQGANGLHTKFAASGSASGKVRQVEVKVRRISDGREFPGKVKFYALGGGEDLYRWIALFEVDAPGEAAVKYQMTAEGLDAYRERVASTRVTFDVTHDITAKAAPAILYPTQYQNIIDEREELTVYGTRSSGAGNTVVDATVQPPSPEPLVDNSGLFDNGTDFWSAVFDLTHLEPDMDNILIVSTNALSQTSSPTIVNITS